MAEYVEVMRQARRICASEKECKKCLMWNTQGAFCRTDVLRSANDDAATEAIVMDWAEAHPEAVYPSWDEGWLEAFCGGKGWQKCPCPMTHFDTKYAPEGCGETITCDECRARPMAPEIAEKLGVRPPSQSRRL